MQRKPLVFVLVLLLFLLGAGFFLRSFFLPRYIEKKILPDLGRQLASSLKGRVYSTGFTAADLGDIVLGDLHNPAVSIGSVHADYTLPALLAKNLAQVTINGMALRLEIAEGRITLPGIDLGKIASQTPVQESVREQSGLSLPFAVGKLEISNGLIVLRHNSELFVVPFALQVLQESPEDSQPLYNFSLQMSPQGEEVRVTGVIDPAGNKGRFSAVAESLDFDRFVGLGRAGGSHINAGVASIRGGAEIGLRPFQLVAANLDIEPELMHIGKTPVRFGAIDPDAGSAISLVFNKDRERLLVRGQGFMLKPLAAALEINGSVMQEQGNLLSSGTVAVRVDETAGTGNQDGGLLLLKTGLELQGDFTLALNKSGKWQAEMKSPGRNEERRQSPVLRVLYDEISLQSGVPSLEVRGQGTADVHEMQMTLVIPRVLVSSDAGELSIPAAGLQALYKQGQDPGGNSLSSASLDITLDGTKFQKKGLHAEADIFLQGKMAPQVINKDIPLQAEGRLTLTKAAISERDSGVRIAAISGNIPWSWPQADREMAGDVKVPQIRWNDVELGSLTGQILLKNMAYSLNGEYTSSLFKGIVTSITGKAEFGGPAYQGELVLQSDVTPFAAVNLGLFDPAFKKSYFSGELGLDGLLKLEPRGMTGMMQVRLQNGRYELPEKKYEVRNIDLSLHIPSLPHLRSAPAQTLNFSEAAIGNLIFSKGKLVWQLESPGAIFLEEGVVQWAGGRVFTNSVRVSPETKEIVIPIFCDRLKLTEILQQFGVQNAEGEGTVNGRIPLHVGRDTIGFEDGFLYSSPGEGGSVKVAAFDLLAAGIPKNTPQFAQVDFAAEALKNFQYNWVRLFLNTEGDNLIMQMQMDGKPVQSLPFTYDSQTGLLQRVEGGRQGIDQPIRLDVNFRLPLNRFLGYTGKIQDLIKKIK